MTEQITSTIYEVNEETGEVVEIKEEVADYLEARIAGASKSSAIAQAGTTPAAVYRAEKHGTTQAYMRARLAACGLTDDKMLKVIKKMTKAEKYVNVGLGKNSRVEIVPDYTAQLAAVRTAWELAGYLGNRREGDEANAQALANAVATNGVKITNQILNVSGEELKKEMLAIARAVQEKRTIDSVRQDMGLPVEERSAEEGEDSDEQKGL